MPKAAKTTTTFQSLSAVSALAPGKPKTARKTESTESLSARERELLHMLTYMRPAWSVTEENFICRFVVPTGAAPDSFGNYWLSVGESPSILWSSHTDTVHKVAGSQHVLYGDGCAFVDSPDSNCLGADCTTGIWLMLQMIRRKIPGLYVFHRAEEIGGRGSSHTAGKEPDRLAGITHAIAFDRKGYSDTITHQGHRTCSDSFAADLSARLNAHNKFFKFSGCANGIFTDTANYTDIIGECTNLSVGYFGQHTPSEYQDVAFACDLADALCGADWSGLVSSRKAGAVDPDDYYWVGGAESSFTHDKKNSLFSRSAPRDLEYFAYDNPGLVADFLHECGFDVADLKSYRDGYTPRVSHYPAAEKPFLSLADSDDFDEWTDDGTALT